MMDTVSNIFRACAEFFGWKRKKLEVDNTPQMQARDQGATDQQIKDAGAKAIAKGDIDQIRRDLAE